MGTSRPPVTETLLLCGVALSTALGAWFWFTQSPAASGPSVVAAFALVSTWTTLRHNLRSFAFAAWVLTSVATAMYYPEWFQTWADWKLTDLISPLIQIIMFGVGTQLSAADFLRAFRMPKAVLVGLLCQFSIMPLLGFGLAHLFGFEGEVAAGIVLIGSCPGGVASNVMAYLARANVALSVTLTALSTLLAPFMTPLAMKLLAGQYVSIDFGAMLVSILWMVITPVAVGLIVNRILRDKKRWLDEFLPIVSMVTIVFILAIITASSREKLLEVGALLVLAAMLHNGIGYLLGYWGAQLFGLPPSAARVVAIEVGMQNGGMGSALAISVLKSSDAALASAIFGPWMNVSGSVLASYWRKRPPADEVIPEQVG